MTTLRDSTTKWAVLLAVGGATAAFAGWTAGGESTVSFAALGPAGFKIDGSNLVFAINLNDVDTGMSLRNKHLLEDRWSARAAAPAHFRAPRGDARRGRLAGRHLLAAAAPRAARRRHLPRHHHP